jgi:hypothetical protein
MGISYDIIEISTNQIVSSFGLKWLQEYTNFNTPSLEQQSMIDYCDIEIEKLEEELSLYENEQCKSLSDLKNQLISKIYLCETEDEMNEILQTFLEERIPNDENKITYIQQMIQHFKSFQDFLVPYIFDNQYIYRGEISY